MGALMAAALSTLWVFALGHPRMFVLGVILTILVFVRHRENIARIKDGAEPKIGQKS